METRAVRDINTLWDKYSQANGPFEMATLLAQVANALIKDDLIIDLDFDRFITIATSKSPLSVIGIALDFLKLDCDRTVRNRQSSAYHYQLWGEILSKAKTETAIQFATQELRNKT